LAIVLLSDKYLEDQWLAAEMTALTHLEDFRKEENLVLLIPTSDMEDAKIPRWLDRWIRPNINFRNGEQPALDALASYIADLSARKHVLAQSPASTDIFIVHGHDDAAKSELEVFLRQVGLNPIVLHRQTDQGLTVIEKFEKHSNVGFAIILLTPDDTFQTPGKGRGQNVEYRARQYVIFEFGFFVGRLGRQKVCCLSRKSVALPSDVSGLIYKSFTEHISEVQFDLARELRHAGYNISL
jgi:predicted nucleotide-binding protein